MATTFPALICSKARRNSSSNCNNNNNNNKHNNNNSIKLYSNPNKVIR